LILSSLPTSHVLDLSKKEWNFEDKDEDKDEHHNKPKQIYAPKRMDGHFGHASQRHGSLAR
jgi:hypothetical protein